MVPSISAYGTPMSVRPSHARAHHERIDRRAADVATTRLADHAESRVGGTGHVAESGAG